MAHVAEISPAFGEFFKHEGAVIQSGNYEISESPLKISAEATERLAQAAREGGINSEFPTFVSGIFKKAVAAGYENEEVAALVKVFRGASEHSETACAHCVRPGEPWMLPSSIVGRMRIGSRTESGVSSCNFRRR